MRVEGSVGGFGESGRGRPMTGVEVPELVLGGGRNGVVIPLGAAASVELDDARVRAGAGGLAAGVEPAELG